MAVTRSSTQNVVTFSVISASVEIDHAGSTKRLIEAIDETIAEVVRECASRAAKGQVALTLTFAPEKGHKGRMVIEAGLKSKKPEGGALPLHVFTDRQGRLVEDDPEQLSLIEPTPIGKESR